MKIYLADLVHNKHAGDNQISGEMDFVVPLNVANIASFVRSQFDNEVDITLFKYPTDLLTTLNTGPPDILAFSHYIWNVDLNLKIISHVKTRWPDVIVVLGGPTIRTNPADLEAFLRLNSSVDFYVTFEGERPFLEIIKHFAMHGPQLQEKTLDIPATAYLKNDALIYEGMPQFEPIETLPSPYLNGSLDKFLAAGLIPLFETNRGCPFQCTFCTWGVSALNKVRKFPIERVMAELEYVATKFPDMPSWIIGDANFGILKRDVDIAKKIRELRKKAPALKHILTWESKNTTERNFEISRIMNDVVDTALVAVQTLDPDVNDAIKRGNISQKDVEEKIAKYHKLGTRVQTHILSGLPGESFQSQINTIAKAFDFSFDDVGVFSTLLLAGSEMESGASREKYHLRTKYRLRAGGYGRYQGITAIDCEEIIRSTSAISEVEMQRLRPIHWLIWFGWNHGFLKPLWKFAHKAYGINPVDIILRATGEEYLQDESAWANLLANFDSDSQAEWFDTREELTKYCVSSEFFDEKENDGFLKAEFKYNAKLLLDQTLFCSLVDLNIMIIKDMYDTSKSSELNELRTLLIESVCFPNQLIDQNWIEEKTLEVNSEIATAISPEFAAQDVTSIEGGKSKLRLVKTLKHMTQIRGALLEQGWHNNKIAAVIKVLGATPDAFTYQLAFGEKNPRKFNRQGKSNLARTA